jgi:hypothetical protein
VHHRISVRLFAALWVAIGINAGASPPEFPILTEGEAKSPAFGTLLVCPHHRHGTAEEGEHKLRGLLREYNGPTSTIWLCRTHTIPSVRQFSPLVQRVVLNPFLFDLFSDRPTATADTDVWPGFNHPCLNGLRELREAAGQTTLVACVDLQGDKSIFGRRGPTFEELEWEVYAAVGAGFKGIAWRGERTVAPSPTKLAQLESGLRRYGPQLAAARSVRWAIPPGDLPLAMLASDDRLFVILLDPKFLNPTRPGDRIEGAQLPLAPRTRFGEIELRPPRNINLVSAEALDGAPQRFTRHEVGYTLKYRFRGGGQMVVCRLDPANEQPPDTPARQ